ncbi:MAG: TetR/AcrR family transcriptional regulator [Bacillota bacterium]
MQTELLFMGHRGRKIGASGEQSRALLLEVAAEEFAQKGYFHTKISDIVKRAGLTQPSFYLYFESKDAIFQELVDLFRRRISELTSKSRVETGVDLSSLPERITTGLTAIFTFFMENQNLTRIGILWLRMPANLRRYLLVKLKPTSCQNSRQDTSGKMLIWELSQRV